MIIMQTLKSKNNTGVCLPHSTRQDSLYRFVAMEKKLARISMAYLYTQKLIKTKYMTWDFGKVMC